MKELFDSEEEIIETAEKVLARETTAGNPMCDAYAALLSQYKKLYKQQVRLIKINDRQQQKLNKTNSILEIQSQYDELTGIYNRRMFNEILSREWRRSLRYQHSLTLLLLDIDHFKSVNDTLGHLAGDALLKKTAEKIDMGGRRAGDIAARYGGEEFVLLLPDTSDANARGVAERIRNQIESETFSFDGKDIHITISIGMATLVPDTLKKPEMLIDMADQALYTAKRTGRNRVCSFSDSPDSGSGHVG